jgi:hypothetical protein
MASVTEYDPELSVRAARARYFADNGFGDEGGYHDAWVIFATLGPLKLGFPNTPGRRRAIRLHDLHHLVTGYQTDFVGEAEIGAWELAGGCGSFTAAWVLNTLALPIAALRAPARARRAWARGARARTLYDAPFDEALLERSLGDLRAQLGAGPDQDREPTPTPAELRRYRVFVALGLLGHALILAAGLALLAALAHGVWTVLA